MGKENLLETIDSGVSNNDIPRVQNEELVVDAARYSSDMETGLPACRVCQCVESDRRGDAALGFLGIIFPVQGAHQSPGEDQTNPQETRNGRESSYVDIETGEGGVWPNHDALIELGCSCKNDLALVHYACALKWFVSYGSTVCEICGNVSENIRIIDYNKIVAALREYTSLRERRTDENQDPDAIAAIRWRCQLSEVSSWFNPHGTNNTNIITNNNNTTTMPQPLSVVNEGMFPVESRATRWAVEGTGILLATGLLTITLAWLIAPRVGKKTAKSGLHILLGGLCAFAVVIFFRFVVLTRIRHGFARYWAILFVFWFLVFGIWASRSHYAHST